jgi:opacity protein-like surface antigen
MTLKKLLFTCSFFFCSSFSYAGIFYLGPSLQYESVAGENNDTYQAISPRLTLGYAEKLEFPYYLAGELFGVVGDINGHPDDSGLKNTPSYGIAVLPGYMIYDKTFLYGRLGTIATRFAAIDSFAWGGQVGLGIETAITETWDVRTEYIFTQYGELGGAGSEFGSPHSNTIAVGFIHRFK